MAEHVLWPGGREQLRDHRCPQSAMVKIGSHNKTDIPPIGTDDYYPVALSESGDALLYADDYTGSNGVSRTRLWRCRSEASQAPQLSASAVNTTTAATASLSANGHKVLSTPDYGQGNYPRVYLWTLDRVPGGPR
jgi:hypothetical protein